MRQKRFVSPSRNGRVVYIIPERLDLKGKTRKNFIDFL